MKAITLHQPWAELIAWHLKLVETRSWPTSYRGPIAIHAGSAKKPYNDMLRLVSFSSIPQRQWRSQLAYYYWQYVCSIPLDEVAKKPVEFGCVVAIANLYDVVPDESIRDTLSPQELAFGNYDDDRYAWLFKDVIPLAAPIPTKGFQRVWNWAEPQEVKDLYG